MMIILMIYFSFDNIYTSRYRLRR